jgi:anhydro-N-acetylmuramic acid kinase
VASDPHGGAAADSQPRRWVAGLMSGTSADGVDAALVELTGRGLAMCVRVRAWLTEAWPEELRRAILQAAQPHGADAAALAALHAQVGHAYAAALRRVCEAAAVPLEETVCVGCHGQTIWHAPQARPATTLQLGAAAAIAERTGLSVVSDFRWRDVAAGGQGAPLVPIVDWLLLRGEGQDRIAVNLGGIINLTNLPRGGDLSAVQAFDVGPGNILLDRLAQELTRGKDRYDAGGRLAVQGRQIKALLRHWANHPFLKRVPPKSTGREEFGEQFVQESLELAARKGWSVLDVLCSATHFAAICLADAVHRFVEERSRESQESRGRESDRGIAGEGEKDGPGSEPESVSPLTRGSRAIPPSTRGDTGGSEVGEAEGGATASEAPRQLILSGGGVHNGLLVRAIAERLADWHVRRSDDFGLPVDAKEAVAFAVLAALAVDGVPGNVPSATGAAGPRLLGSFTPGSAENWRRLLAMMPTA